MHKGVGQNAQGGGAECTKGWVRMHKGVGQNAQGGGAENAQGGGAECTRRWGTHPGPTSSPLPAPPHVRGLARVTEADEWGEGVGTNHQPTRPHRPLSPTAAVDGTATFAGAAQCHTARTLHRLHGHRMKAAAPPPHPTHQSLIIQPLNPPMSPYRYPSVSGFSHAQVPFSLSHAVRTPGVTTGGWGMHLHHA